MAVSAKFTADFTSFFTAVDKAETELKSFETQAGRVEKSLSRMTDSFSGRKLIQDATLMAKAVENVGGASALTEAELKRVGGTIAEASAKMKALGIDVPKSFTAITDASSKLEKNTGGLSGALGKASGILGTFGVGLSAAAVVGFGRAMLSNADALQKMSDRTGIGVVGLQRLRAVAEDSGNTLEQVTDAVNKLQSGLVSGQAASAVSALGLSVSDLKALKPEEQFAAIGTAIRGIQDPAEQTRRAIEIFGRAGADLLPTLKADMTNLGDATVAMSEDSVRALDAIGDAIGRLKRDAIGFAGEVTGRIAKALMTNLDESDDALRKQANALHDLTHPDPRDIPQPSMFREGHAASLPLFNSLPDLDRFGDDLDRLKKQFADNAKAAEEMRKALDRVEHSGDKAAFVVMDLDQALRQLRTSPPDIKPVLQITDGFKALGPVLSQSRIEGEKFRIEFDKFTVGAGAAAGKIDTVTRSSRTLGQTFGDVAGILNNISGLLAELGAIAARTGEAILKNLAEGDVFGAFIAGATGAAAAIGKLWGKLTKAESRKVNDLRDDFVKAAGGLDALNRKAVGAGQTLDRFLHVSTVKAYTAEIERLQKAFEFQDAAMKTFTDTVKKYNLSIGEIGATAATRLLGDEAKELYTDFKTLTAGGIDAAVAITGMQDALSQMVRDAVSSGVSLPKQFEPIIQQMRDLGLLTDDVGEQFTDAELDGLSFGGTLTEEIDGLTQAIKDLTDAIGRGLGGAISNLPPLPSIQGPFGHPSSEDRERNPTAALGGLVTNGKILKFARGGGVKGFGSDVVPALLRPGELVMTPERQQQLAQALLKGNVSGGGGVSVALTIQAWDGSSIETWLRNGGDRQLTAAIVPHVPGELIRRGVIRNAA